MDAANIYTSAQAAELLEVSTSTLRTWKARKSDQLQEGIHWVQENNQTAWTHEGIEVLIQIRDSVAVKNASETPSVAASETLGVSLALQRYEDLANTVADAVALQLVQRIDKAVMQRVKSAIAKPTMTSQECVAILTEFGLAPADPSALLGSSVAGYLAPQTPDN